MKFDLLRLVDIVFNTLIILLLCGICVLLIFGII